MKQNIGLTGRAARAVVGLLILGIGYRYHSWWGLLGLIPIAEGIFGWCALRHFTGCDRGCKKGDGSDG